MPEVSLISAELATVCVESFLYGIFFVLAIVSLFLLVRRLREMGGLSKYNPGYDSSQSTSIVIFIVASVVLFLCNTIHWLTVVIRLFYAFVNFEGGAEPIAFYADLGHPTEVVQSAALITAALCNDMIIIYRLWIVWAYNPNVVVIPICTLLGLTICGYGSTYQLTRLHPGEDIFVSAAGRWLTSNCVFTLCTNIYSTSMIAWRIWRVNAASRAHGGGNLTAAMVIIVESAAIYTVWTIFFLITYEVRTNLQFVSNCGLPIVAGISFTLINVRVGMGWAQKAHQESLTTFAAAAAATGRTTETTGEQSFAMQPVAVHISRVTKQESSQKGSSADLPTKYVDLTPP